MNEPTVRVTQKPCPTCGGTGEPQHAPTLSGSAQRTRMTEVGGVCPTCKGEREIAVDVPLSKLLALLNDPGSFANRFAGQS